MSAALCLNPTFSVYAPPTSAASPEASEVSELAHNVMRDQSTCESLFGAKRAALSELIETVQSVQVDDEQDRVSHGTVDNARDFVLSLPDDIPMPEIGVDPDGEISLTWYGSRKQIFSVSISDSDRIAFAWLDGSDSGHAVARFRPPTLPDRFLSNLRSMIAYASPALRFA